MFFYKSIIALSAIFFLASCDSNNGGLNRADGSGKNTKSVSHPAVDYSKGRAMNQKLGRGINLGNSWDSPGIGAHPDCGWNNCIKDEDFQIIKAAGFNSVRLPVRWEHDLDVNGTIDPQRLAGVKEDIQIANSLGMPVVLDFHHHINMNAAAMYVESNPSDYQEELAKFASMWVQVATALNDIPDDMIVFEIMNEPHDIKKKATVNEIMLTGYNAIRSVSLTKTIMFEANGYSKFGAIKQLELPQDGNIIVSGHYYEPYEFTHQGTAGKQYPCGAVVSSSRLSQIAGEFKTYVDSVKAYYPDTDGIHSVPINMGEFGAIGRTGSMCGDEAPSEAMRAQWTQHVINAAESYGISWHYWSYGKTSGFQAYNQDAGEWFPEMKKVFDAFSANPFPNI